jgi:hypothetical protein
MPRTNIADTTSPVRKKQTMLVLLVLTAALSSTHGMADPKFTGKDAAYIDWAAKNCEAASTEKEHKLAEEGNAKGGDQFIREWTEQGSKIAAGSSTPSKQEAMCSDIKEWYGPSGSRLSGLITWKREPPTQTKSSSNSQSPDSGKRGKRSGQ